jgi:hypothetical protein
MIPLLFLPFKTSAMHIEKGDYLRVLKFGYFAFTVVKRYDFII